MPVCRSGMSHWRSWGQTSATLYLAQGELTGYVGYPGSDCRNGAVVRVPDGHALMERLPSHHSLLLTGHHREGVKLVAEVFDLKVDVLCD